MKVYSPTKFSLIKNLLILIAGALAFFFILSGFFNIIAGIVAVLIIVVWYGYYIYRDYLSFKIDNNRIVVSRFNKPIASYERKECEFSTVYPKKKLLWLVINNNGKDVTYDCDLLGKDQFLSLLQSLAVPIKAK